MAKAARSASQAKPQEDTEMVKKWKSLRWYIIVNQQLVLPITHILAMDQKKTADRKKVAKYQKMFHENKGASGLNVGFLLGGWKEEVMGPRKTKTYYTEFFFLKQK